MKRSHGPIGLAWLWAAAAAAGLAGCGGGQPEDLIARSEVSPSARPLAAMNQAAPAMAAVLAQPPGLAPSGDRPTARRQDATGATPRRTDLVWYNADAGLTVSWTMSGLQVLQQQVLLQHPQWRITHVADLDGNGQDDYVWENAQTGQMAVWLMSGPSLADATEIKLLLQSPGWQVAFTGDFNGDGKSDLFFHNAKTGQSALWLMDGSRILDSRLIENGPGRRVLAVGDLDGDGRSDLVWGGGNDLIDTWLMQGTQRIGGRDGMRCDATCQQGLANGLVSPTPSGRSMLAAVSAGTTTALNLLQLEAEGPVSVSSYSSALFFNSLPSGVNARVQALADLQGNGVLTALVQDTTTNWTLGVHMNTAGQFTPPPETLLKLPGWQIIHTPDLDGDDRADLIWHHRDTGHTVVWLMNGLQATAQRSLFQSQAWVVTATRHGSGRPLAVVGPAQQVQVGDTARLEGSTSQARGSGSLTYRWTLESKPSGSAAVLDDATLPRPSFKTDLPGRYVARLVVTRGGVASRAVSTTVEAAAAPSALAGVAIFPGQRAINGRPYLEVEFRTVHALRRGQLICLAIPAAFGALWDKDLFFPSGIPRIALTWHSVVGRRLCASAGDDVPAGTAMTVNVWQSYAQDTAFWNPPAPGSYPVSVWSTTDPTPVEVQVRILPAETKPQDVRLEQLLDPARESRTLGVDFVTPSGLPPGARIQLRVDGVDTRSARLVAPNDILQLAPNAGDRQLLRYTVTAPAGVPAGTRISADLTRVTGLRDYRCTPPAPLPEPNAADLSTSEDREPVLLEMPRRPSVGTAVANAAVSFVPDATSPGSWGRWQLAFHATSGLPSGARIHLSQDFTPLGRVFVTGPFSTDLACDLTLDVGDAMSRSPGQQVLVLSGLEPRPAPGSTFTFTLYTSADDTPVKLTAKLP